ncbi:DNA-binding protein [Amycolatopsis sp. A1MSW2902]|uniref:helix-turn-helix domain-containing protein n=1 Tax=Amycolatopsis sp. A1MSW2902 TaxID=687413 RepID=UPI00307F292E
MAYPGEPLFVQDLPQAGGEKTVATLSPTAVRRWIRITLRRMRKAAGHEPEDVAARLGKTVQAYRHYETGTRLPSASDVEVLLNWYGFPERVPFFRQLLKAAQRGKDWWKSFPDTGVPEWFQLYLGLESNAATISSYDAQWVPGLMQTADYARELYRAGDRGLSDGEIATKVELRLARQPIVTREEDPLRIVCVLDEAVLYRQVGGARVMSGQLDHLGELASRSNVEIRILTAASGAHAGTEGTFTILDYPEEFVGDPGTVYAELRPEGRYFEEPSQVEDYRNAFRSLYEQADAPECTPDYLKAAKEKLR